MSKIMGILNITPDSFSDGLGVARLDYDQLMMKARKLVSDGADIIDIGGESTRPNAQGVSPDEELERIMPMVRPLIQEGYVVSVDTRNASTAYACLNEGVHIINDVSGGRHSPEIFEVLASYPKAQYVLMHSRGTPMDMMSKNKYDDLLPQVIDELKIQLEKAFKKGVLEDQIIIDPGVGFAKSAHDSFEIIRHVKKFKELGFPVLLGHSRKSFLEMFGKASALERLGGSIAVSLFASEEEIDYLRVHDVFETHQAIRVYEKLKSVGKENE